MEKNYQFRSRMDQVHKPGRRDPAAAAAADETVIDENWLISFASDAPASVVDTAKDLQDYFLVSMDMELKLCPGGDKGIFLEISKDVTGDGTFVLSVTADSVKISASGDRAVHFGGVYLEDIMNLREAPFLKRGTEKRERLITPRIVHSGWGMDKFPDAHLNAILHAGFDAITIFIKDIDLTQTGYLDINDVIFRAAKYGIDTYLYSYLPAYKHPDDPDADEFFENVYTRLLNYHKGVKGVMLVGESAVFPSKDPATTGKRWTESDPGDSRPSPGWWPCTDYPAWITKVRDAVRKAIPDAKIIFNTYNWGWTDLEVRKRFLKNLPEGVIVQVTFDIFSKIRRENLPCVAMDYTASVCKPGYYFDSECHAAAEYGVPLLSTANTAGMTWDFGDVPYIPVPQQWIRRFRELDRFRRECGLTRFYDCHHYGWWPSVITEIGKWYFQSPQCDPDEMLRRLAVRTAGRAGAEKLLEAWNFWSDAIPHLPATNEDQYGPLRVGPSYPLIFAPNLTRTMGGKEIKFPTAPHAHFGYHIIKTLYQPFENINQPPGGIRYPVELRELDTFLSLWDKGLAAYEQALAAAPERKRAELEAELNLGRFIRCSAATCRNVKQWWLLNQALISSADREKSLKLLDEIEALAKAEIENAKSAIPFVEKDSRLGWEPSMEYVCDKWHIDWKIKQTTLVITNEIRDFRTILNLGE